MGHRLHRRDRPVDGQQPAQAERRQDAADLDRDAQAARQGQHQRHRIGSTSVLGASVTDLGVVIDGELSMSAYVMSLSHTFLFHAASDPRRSPLTRLGLYEDTRKFVCE